MTLVTLLSDFGMQDASAASVKGVMMRKVPDATIIDITHLIKPMHVQQAAYILNASYIHFSEGSFHIVLCDIFSQPVPRLLLCKKNNHYIFTPDNGLLPLAFNGEYDEVYKCLDLDDTMRLEDWLIACGDIITSLKNGKQPSELGFENCAVDNPLLHWQPRLTGNILEGHVIHIDRFENVVVNITQKQFNEARKNRPFSIQFVRHTITEINNRYSDVKQDEMLCRFNSAGYMEICINRGKAASLLGLKLDKEQHLIYNSIKISFE